MISYRLSFFQSTAHDTSGGEHQFDWLKDLSINWLYTNATANRTTKRDYRFDADPQGNFFFAGADNNQTMYADLVDKDQSWRVDGKLPVQPSIHHKSHWAAVLSR